METREALFATSYLPPIGYMAYMLRYRKIGIEYCESYVKQSYRNRAEIMTANGRLKLSVPVEKRAGSHTMTKEIGISYAEPWNVRHWRAIESAYRAAPYFLYYKDRIEEAMMGRYDRLVELNERLLNELLTMLKIDCEIEGTSDFVEEGTRPEIDDYRYTIGPKKQIEGLLFESYDQVFAERHRFEPNLSIVDLLFNIGPASKGYLQRVVASSERAKGTL